MNHGPDRLQDEVLRRDTDLNDRIPRRLFAIGDIHGCSIALRTLIDAIAPNPDDTIVVLGDVIDYGPDTKGGRPAVARPLRSLPAHPPDG